jgi:hypothetical protein
VLAACAALLVAAWSSSCGIGEGEVAVVPDGDVPAALRSPGTAPSTSAAPGPTEPTTAVLHWVAEGALVGEPVTFGSAPPPQQLLALLQAGPGPADPAGTEVRTAVPPGGGLRVDRVEDGVVVLSVPRSFGTSTGADQLLAVAQVVVTLDSLPGVDGVELRQGDSLVEVPSVDGTLVRRTLRGEDYASLVVPSPANR